MWELCIVETNQIIYYGSDGYRVERVTDYAGALVGLLTAGWEPFGIGPEGQVHLKRPSRAEAASPLYPGR
ncbi:MAG: hypothetical protein Kow00120_11460 [Anaerolineae bacterium]